MRKDIGKHVELNQRECLVMNNTTQTLEYCMEHTLQYLMPPAVVQKTR
jgi:hypothetical protein